MVESLARIGDRILERILPKTTANAVCGGWISCGCRWVGGQYINFQRRVDPEHGGICVPCQAANICV
jgi:hypothetical protein